MINPKTIGKSKELDSTLEKKFSALQSVPERNAEKGARTKAAFMAEVRGLPSPLITKPEQPHNWWPGLTKREVKPGSKTGRPLLSPVLTAIIVIALLFGAGSLTVASAQKSQPGDALYSVKTLSEDIQLGLTVNPQSEQALMLDMTTRRSEEIIRLLNEGKTPGTAVQTRYQNQVDRAITLALTLPAERVIPALQETRTRLQSQLNSMTGLSIGKMGPAARYNEQLQFMLRERLQWVNLGIEDSVRLREMLQLRNRDGSGDQKFGTPSQGVVGENPWITGTPTPGSGYGPGPFGTATCSPTGGYGPGPHSTVTRTPGIGPSPDPTMKPGLTKTPGPTRQPGPTKQPNPTHQPEPTPKHDPTSVPGPKNQNN